MRNSIGPIAVYHTYFLHNREIHIFGPDFYENESLDHKRFWTGMFKKSKSKSFSAISELEHSS